MNKKSISFSSKITVMKLLKYLNSSKNVAVFVNGKAILMGEYETYELKDKDEVKVIKPLGGG